MILCTRFVGTFYRQLHLTPNFQKKKLNDLFYQTINQRHDKREGNKDLLPHYFSCPSERCKKLINKKDLRPKEKGEGLRNIQNSGK